jgi:hypothetical protein
MAYLRALQRGDGMAARALCVGTVEQKQWAQSLAVMIGGMRSFDQALYKKFGPRFVQVHVDMRDALRTLAEEPIELIRDAAPQIDGDHARIDPTHNGFTSRYQQSIFLQKTPQGWRIDPLQTYAKNANADELKKISESFDAYRQGGEAFRSVASEVLAGHFKSIDEANRALAERMSDGN